MERAKEASGQTGASTTDRSRRNWKVVEVHPYPVDVLASVLASQRKHTRRYADVTLLLALTGLRFGKLRGLRVRDVVDVPYPALVVKRSIPQSGRTGAVIERATTKSGRSRLVPLTERVRPLVESWAAGRQADDLLFPAPEGGYLHAQNWRRAVRWTTTGPDRRPHDLRHTAASLRIAAGIDLKTVSAWLGHSRAKLTLDTYGHLMSSDAHRAALAGVNRVVGGLTGSSPAASRILTRATRREMAAHLRKWAGAPG